MMTTMVWSEDDKYDNTDNSASKTRRRTFKWSTDYIEWNKYSICAIIIIRMIQQCCDE